MKKIIFLLTSQFNMDSFFINIYLYYVTPIIIILIKFDYIEIPFHNIGVIISLGKNDLSKSLLDHNIYLCTKCIERRNMNTTNGS